MRSFMLMVASGQVFMASAMAAHHGNGGTAMIPGLGWMTLAVGVFLLVSVLAGRAVRLGRMGVLLLSPLGLGWAVLSACSAYYRISEGAQEWVPLSLAAVAAVVFAVSLPLLFIEVLGHGETKEPAR